MTKSLLSKKDRETLHWRGQIQKLRRIAVRAQSKADWMVEMQTRYSRNGLDKDMIADCEAQRVKAQARAIAAAEEMLAIAKANNDPRVAGIR